MVLWCFTRLSPVHGLRLNSKYPREAFNVAVPYNATGIRIPEDIVAVCNHKFNFQMFHLIFDSQVM